MMKSSSILIFWHACEHSCVQILAFLFYSSFKFHAEYVDPLSLPSLETSIQGFDLCVICNSQLAMEEYVDSGDDCHVQDAKHELSQEVTNELKSPHSETVDADKRCREAQHFAHDILESKEQIDASSNAITDCVGYDERYKLGEEEQVILATESSEGSAVMYSSTMVSGSYIDVKKTFPKPSPGETSMKKTIIRKGMEKLPAGYLPQRKTSSGETFK